MSCLATLGKQSALTVVGVVLIKLSTGVISAWGSINLYILSCLHHRGHPVTPATNSIILLCCIVPITFIILIATRLSQRFGYARVIRVCAWVFMLAPMLLRWRFDAQLFTIFGVLLPTCGFGISSVPIINCLWTQFPSNKNVATSIAVVSFGLGGILWNYLFTISVNPYNENTSVFVESTGMHLFSEEVSSRVLGAMNTGYLMCGCLFVGGAYLVRKNTQYEDSSESGEFQLSARNTLLQAQIVSHDEHQTKAEAVKPKQKMSLRQALTDYRFVYIFLISFFSGIYQIFLGMNIKIVYLPVVGDDRFLVYCAMVSTAFSILGAFFWGYLGDRVGFYNTLLLFAGLDVLVKIYSIFATTKETLMVFFLLLGFVDKAMLTIIGPGFVKIFGIGLATQLLPYKGISVFFGFIVAPLVYLLLSPVMSAFSYLNLLGGTSLVGLLLSLRLYQTTQRRQNLLAPE